MNDLPAFAVEVRSQPTPFSFVAWVRDGGEIDPRDGGWVPGEVLAEVVVTHDGTMTVSQTTDPWSFDGVDSLSEFGTALLSVREMAEQALGPNWTSARRIVLATS